MISADLPLSVLVVPDGRRPGRAVANGDAGAPLGREPEIARVLPAFKRARRDATSSGSPPTCTTRAAHHYDPRARPFTDFDPFWEFVSGPIAAETFPDKNDVLDRTFGPEVVFSKGNDTGRRQSPRAGNQFFGHVAIAADGLLTVTLHDGSRSRALVDRTGARSRQGP